jgi:hypothetical protein
LNSAYVGLGNLSLNKDRFLGILIVFNRDCSFEFISYYELSFPGSFILPKELILLTTHGNKRILSVEGLK